MLKVKNLKKSFGSNLVLKGIDLNVESGDVIAIIGPSGSGKTTLLRCLNFLEKADEGTLIFNGKEYDLKTIDSKQIQDIRKQTAFVFQNFNLFANKTALENITLGLIVARKMNQEKANEIAKKLLDKVGLSEKYDSYPSQLSGGQQQRVAIARALATSPSIIYFDEPTSALDPELISDVLKVIKDLVKEGMTMIIVTHEINFAKNVSNKIVFMDEGNILKMADTEEFFKINDNKRISNFIKNILEKGE